MPPGTTRPTRAGLARTLIVVAIGLLLTGLTGCDGLSSRSVDVTGGVFSEDEIDAQVIAEAERSESPVATLDDVRAAAFAYTQYWVADPEGDGPGDIEDLAPYLKNDPRILDFIRSGELIVHWHATLKDMPSGAQETVLIYGRNTPLSRGPVAFADTSVRTVEAFDFAKMPRASIER